MRIRNPLTNPSELDILGILLIMTGTFFSVAGFQLAWRLYEPTSGLFGEGFRGVCMGVSGLVLILAGLLFFRRSRQKRRTDILDEEQFDED